jgi:predicted transcriptional regulator
MKERVLWCRISQQLDEKLQALAARTGRNRAEIARALLRSGSFEDLPSAWQDPEEAAVLAEVER